MYTDTSEVSPTPQASSELNKKIRPEPKAPQVSFGTNRNVETSRQDVNKAPSYSRPISGEEIKTGQKKMIHPSFHSLQTG